MDLLYLITWLEALHIKDIFQDLSLVDFEPYRHFGANITAFRIVDPHSKVVTDVVDEWHFEMLTGNPEFSTSFQGHTHVSVGFINNKTLFIPYSYH